MQTPSLNSYIDIEIEIDRTHSAQQRIFSIIIMLICDYLRNYFIILNKYIVLLLFVVESGVKDLYPVPEKIQNVFQ